MITIYYHLLDESSLHFLKEQNSINNTDFTLVTFKNLQEFNEILDISIKSVLRCTVNFIHDYLNCDKSLLNTSTIVYLQTKLYYDEDLNLYNCMQKINTHLMLNVGEFYPLKFMENLKLSENTKLFIKPSSCLKYFDATLINSEYYIGEYLTYNTFDYDISNELCLIAPIKHIENESRFFVVNGKVITGSYYRINNIYSEIVINDTEEIFKITQQYVDLFNPCKAFVIDLALCNNQYKIIEYNPINCAGVYASDYSKLIQELSLL